MNNEDISFMRRTMELAEKGRGQVSPNPVVGAVLVRKGKIIAEDWHRKYGEAHAERNLLEKFEGEILQDDVLYVTLEPCCHQGKTPPCTEIILGKRVKKVVVGLLDPNPEVSGKGIRLLREGGVEVEVVDGRWSMVDGKRQNLFSFRAGGGAPLLKGQGVEGELLHQLSWQNRFFFTWVTKRRPWVSLKIAQTLDGRVVPERGKQFWLTGEESRVHVHQQRAQYDAILVGLGTVLADDPALTVRLGKLQGPKLQDPNGQKQPQVVVLDAALAIPLNREIVRPGTIIFRGRQFKRREKKKKALEREGLIVLEVDTNEEGYLNLRQVLDELASRGISSVYVEGGAAVWSSFLREELVDELMMYLAPQVLGSGISSFEDLGFAFGKEIQFLETQLFGQDVFWHGVFEKVVGSW